MDFHTIELFAGVGQLGEGLRAGLAHLGRTARPIAYVEREAYAASVLAARMQDGSLDAAPVWSDVTTFDAARWAGAVDCVVAGFPCQDLSLAGRRAGLDGKRSGLFFEVTRIARDCGARYLFLENVAGIASATATVVDEAEGTLDERAAARVLGELADLGWHAEWATISASDVGASHGRARWFCWAWREVADSTGNGHEQRGNIGYLCQTDGRQRGALQRLLGRTGGKELGHPTSQGPQEPRQTRERELPTQAGAGLHHRPEQPGSCVANTDGARQRTGWRAGCVPFDADQNCSAVANTPSQDGSSLRWRSQEEFSSTRADSHGIFAPGPTDPTWPGIIQHWPHLAPALEPSFHRVVDGLARRMDDCRPQRLKCCGNGVVAAQAGFALVGLVRRMTEHIN